LSLDKHSWSPSPLLGQVVLVTSVDAHGVIDVAPKSWASMAAFAGPIVGFGCAVRCHVMLPDWVQYTTSTQKDR